MAQTRLTKREKKKENLNVSTGNKTKKKQQQHAGVIAKVVFDGAITCTKLRLRRIHLKIQISSTVRVLLVGTIQLENGATVVLFPFFFH